MSRFYEAIQFDKTDISVAAFSRYLHALGFPHRLSEQQDKLVLWVYDVQHVAIVNQLHEQFLHNDLPVLAVSKRRPLDWIKLMADYPVTLALIVLSIIGFSIVQSQWLQGLSMLSFQGFVWNEDNITVNKTMLVIEQITNGQLWRLLTPIFLHFDIMHITFNMTLLWFFGSQIEKIDGSLFLLSHVLLIGILSNCIQFFSVPEHLFGGMSGVDYGLLAYCFLINYLNRKSVFVVPPGFFWFSLVMLVLGFFDVFAIFGYAVANIVHLFGLLTGFILAFIFKNKKRFYSGL